MMRPDRLDQRTRIPRKMMSDTWNAVGARLFRLPPDPPFSEAVGTGGPLAEVRQTGNRIPRTRIRVSGHRDATMPPPRRCRSAPVPSAASSGRPLSPFAACARSHDAEQPRHDSHSTDHEVHHPPTDWAERDRSIIAAAPEKDMPTPRRQGGNAGPASGTGPELMHRRPGTTDFARTREFFRLPPGLTYLDGNSLGPLPRRLPEEINRVLADEWGGHAHRSLGAGGLDGSTPQDGRPHRQADRRTARNPSFRGTPCR